MCAVVWAGGVVMVYAWMPEMHPGPEVWHIPNTIHSIFLVKKERGIWINTVLEMFLSLHTCKMIHFCFIF